MNWYWPSNSRTIDIRNIREKEMKGKNNGKKTNDDIKSVQRTQKKTILIQISLILGLFSFYVCSFSFYHATKSKVNLWITSQCSPWTVDIHSLGQKNLCACDGIRNFSAVDNYSFSYTKSDRLHFQLYSLWNEMFASSKISFIFYIKMLVTVSVESIS